METSGFTRAAVGAGARTLDGAWYASDAVFAAETERIFVRAWACAGHESSIARPGDYVLATVAGESLIVVRDALGDVRAFYNVCRHRGTRLCEDAAGRFAGAIRCPYHAWTYALDGTLAAARSMRDVPGFDREAYPLAAASVRIAGGFVFVSLAVDADGANPPPIAALAPRLARWNTAGLREARRITYDVACNWKLIVQNYSECYHCPVIHPQLDALSPSDSGRNDFTSGPVLGGYSGLRPGARALTTTGARARPPLGTVDGDDLRRSYYYAVFPTLLLSLHADMVMCHALRPVAPDRTEIACTWLFDPVEIERPGFDPSDAVDFWDVTNRQDWRVCESTQAGVSSRSYRPGPYARSEGLLHAFDRYYLATMDGASSPQFERPNA